MERVQVSQQGFLKSPLLHGIPLKKKTAFAAAAGFTHWSAVLKLQMFGVFHQTSAVPFTSQ